MIAKILLLTLTFFFAKILRSKKNTSVAVENFEKLKCLGIIISRENRHF